MKGNQRQARLGVRRRSAYAIAVALGGTGLSATAQDTTTPPQAPATLDSIQVAGSWLGTGLQDSVKTFAGGRTVMERSQIKNTGATSIGDVMRRIPGVQATDNSGSAGSAVSLNIGVRGLTGRYSPRSTILLDGVPMAFAPYGQPQLSVAPVSLNNIESIDVVRGGGAVRYGPQNVGGIINFTTRPIPSTQTLSGDVSVRENVYGKGGGSNTQYSTFLGAQTAGGFGVALLYSGMSGTDWRKDSNEKVNDLALKFRYELGPSSELYGKLSYYDVKSRTPGGLTVAQYDQDPFQNTRRTDYWNGDRKGVDLGYINTLSDTSEVEVRVYDNESYRSSTLINAARTQLAYQPRHYRVLGIEPRYTQRFELGSTTNDVTVGYRYIRERGDDGSFNQAIATGKITAPTRFDNATDAQAAYIDDRIVFGAWRITPGIRFEHIDSDRLDTSVGQRFSTLNNKPLPSLNVAYLLTRELTLFANYGTSFGPVQNVQLNSQTATNPLKPELARTTEAGMRWQDRHIHAEVTVFHLRFNNQILQVPGINPPTFQNIGATDHKGVETAFDYQFDDGGPWRGLDLYANYTYTKAIQESGATKGLDVPFYARNTDTAGAKYHVGSWTFNLSSTHQTGQYADTANTVQESADARIGRVPGFRLWNAQATWDVPGWKGSAIDVGLNNVTDKRYYTRNVDGNPGRMVGAPRTTYVQLRMAI